MLIAVTINLAWDILQIQNSLNGKVLLKLAWAFYCKDVFNIVKLFTVYSFNTSIHSQAFYFPSLNTFLLHLFYITSSA